MNFGQALEALQAGKCVKRAIWYGYWFMGHIHGCPLIVAKLRDNEGYAGAQPYQADMLAQDWEVVHPPVEAFGPKLDATVFPSEVRSVAVRFDDTYGGAHTYSLQKTVGFENGETKYINEYDFISFVKKDADGTMQPGIQSEQLVIALIDRHQKLNAVFPSPQAEKGIAGLQQFLDAQRERVEDRMGRGVMGDLKK